ncbi:(2,3-dihydroxybenzoyl)adenylate synthase [Spongiactinospora rosea]|uniref:(2,3-dihydroxybenzoyl)adenylate synthase n=1 Tax=Spongiactinospora rosea TaxID=2248750 RepID=A0A366M4N4_9ACTN|nr:AMP-binding protein [Spongiactinospora rosea]RBQ21145.1 (2,3-dihydroxybenzoyl)adenylate synthase [Spongiactinospora rosea]
MSVDVLRDVLQSLGVTRDEITPEARLRADLELSSVETTELELELDRGFGVRVDLWDAKDYRLEELAELVRKARDRPRLDIPRVPAADRYRELGLWRPETLDAVILRQAATRPGAVALVYGARRMTYGELATAVEGAAGRLRELGVSGPDPVVVQLPNTIEYVVLVLALMRLGAPPVLTLPSLRAYELDRILELTQATAIAVPARQRRADHPAMVAELRGRHPRLATVLISGGEGPSDLVRLCAPEPGPDVPPPGADAADPALMLLSSGTTGPPKVMVRTHEDYGYVVRTTTEVAGVDAGTVYMAVLPGTHTFTLAYPGILGTLSAGGTVVLAGPEDPRRALELIQRERVTHTAAVPGLVAQWLGVLRGERYDLSSLKVLQVGGAKLDPDLAEQAVKVLPCTLQQVYGMSEGLTNFTRLDDPIQTILGTQGRPATPHDEITIVDEDERPVPPGEVGQLLTRGPYTIAGYYRDPEATAKAFTADGFYRTGDLVKLLPDGNVQVTGRVKNLINRGGEKVCAEELEEFVRQMPEVAAAGVAPAPHPVYGETVCLFVVPAGPQPPDLLAVRRYLTSCGLAGHKLPERLEVLDALPVIGVGKLDRTALRERARSLESVNPASGR